MSTENQIQISSSSQSHSNNRNQSELPLLFASGYPISLAKMKVSQLELFIPFMTECSLVRYKSKLKKTSEPIWWPTNVIYEIPLKKPETLTNKEWKNALRSVVTRCYQYHGLSFLLSYCDQLASYEHKNLRYISNSSTTSMYHRQTNRLLVIFQNTNIFYDRVPTNRMTLLPKNHGSKTDDTSSPEHEHMVNPVPYDIYLCDDCDVELYSFESYQEHERECKSKSVLTEFEDDDDVIFCEAETKALNFDVQSSFLLNYGLRAKTELTNFKKIPKAPKSPHINGKVNNIKKNNRLFSVVKTACVPFSSPAGQVLLRSRKTEINEEYITERLNRIERFCNLTTKNETNKITKQKRILKTFNLNNFEPGTYNQLRRYKFPRRQNSKLTVSFVNNFNRHTMESKNLRVRVSRSEVKDYINTKRLQRLKRTNPAAAEKILKIVDFIDLCSSSDDENENKIAIDKKELLTHTDSNLDKDMLNSKVESSEPYFDSIIDNLNFDSESPTKSSSNNNNNNNNNYFSSVKTNLLIT